MRGVLLIALSFLTACTPYYHLLGDRSPLVLAEQDDIQLCARYNVGEQDDRRIGEEIARRGINCDPSHIYCYYNKRYEPGSDKYYRCLNYRDYLRYFDEEQDNLNWWKIWREDQRRFRDSFYGRDLDDSITIEVIDRD